MTEAETELAIGGNYQYRIHGERHLLNPLTVSKLSIPYAADELRDVSGIFEADR